MTIVAFDSPVIAHRGASADAPENTLAALNLAHAQKAPWVEFDVKLTRDGVPILMHDDTLDRTTTGKGPVAETDWTEIRKLDAGGWFDARFKGERVPQLAEALRLILDNGMRANIEIKPCPGRAKATAMVTLIEATKLWPEDQPPPLISSFDEEALLIASQLQPHWPRGFAFAEWDRDWRETARRIDAQALTVNADLVNDANAPALKQTGLPILAYTVDDPARVKELLGRGASAVFCNNPGKMIAALGTYGRK